MSYHDKRNTKGRFARSSHPTKDALRKRRARAAAKAGHPVYAVKRVATGFASRKPAWASIESVDGTRPSEAQAKVLANQTFSFAVSYIRPDDVRANGSVAANRNNPSSRRFGTRKEAEHHAARFVAKHSHLGSYVTEVDERPTSWVNVETGLTNEVA
jgi:hypothetical protein